MNTSESNQSDENKIIETLSSLIEVRNLDMDVSFLHYEIEEDKYMEYCTILLLLSLLCKRYATLQLN
jgi:hypothetical protein